MPFMPAAFVYTVWLYSYGCVHTTFKFFLMMPHINVSVFLMCVYKFKVMPHHQKFSGYAPDAVQLESGHPVHRSAKVKSPRRQFIKSQITQ